jgi:ABC-type Fe3+/spermidine/putrescine transport system ATPase subunit
MLWLDFVTKRFDTTVAVDELTLEVNRGECISLLGPSGCGKTTTLRLIAGFETPSSGRILLNDRDLTKQPPHRRGIGMVFQNYALFPHLNVFENVAFGLREAGFSREETAQRVQATLERVDLSGFADRRVQALSGGQQQRVALARALAPEPGLLLLDEPLSNLDATLRERTRRELRTLLKDVGITSVFVTHDQEEAFALSDRIALLDRGRLQQFDTPERLYNFPSNAFVASFVGRGATLQGRLVSYSGMTCVCQLAHGPRWAALLTAQNRPQIGSAVRVLARPEALAISKDTQFRVGLGTVTDRRFAGAFAAYTVQLGEVEVIVHAAIDAAEIGERVVVHPITPASVFAFVE